MEYATEYYNEYMKFGGVRYASFNYSDANWKEYLKNKVPILNSIQLLNLMKILEECIGNQELKQDLKVILSNNQRETFMYTHKLYFKS